MVRYVNCQCTKRNLNHARLWLARTPLGTGPVLIRRFRHLICSCRRSHDDATALSLWPLHLALAGTGGACILASFRMFKLHRQNWAVCVCFSLLLLYNLFFCWCVAFADPTLGVVGHVYVTPRKIFFFFISKRDHPNHRYIVSGGPMARPQYMQTSWLIIETYLPSKFSRPWWSGLRLACPKGTSEGHRWNLDALYTVDFQ